MKTLAELLLMLTTTAPFGGFVVPLDLASANVVTGSSRSNWRNCIAIDSYNKLNASV